MNLYLVQHAEAKPESEDPDRPLTEKGWRDIRKIAPFIASQAEFTPKTVQTTEERVKLVFPVEVALAENPGGVLKPGMPADAVVRWQSDAPWVPPSAGRR